MKALRPIVFFFLPGLVITLITLIVGCKQSNDTDANHLTIYAMGMVFRESPYADIEGAEVVSKEYVFGKKHFELDYDSLGRLVEVRFQLGDDLVAYSDRFVRAPRTVIVYTDEYEIRTYFNEYGHRTLVSGDVYETRIKLNDLGQREELTFYNHDSDIVENDFRIARYRWKQSPNGDLIEYRYDINETIQRNRPGFGYYITRFQYDETGLLQEMINLGKAGMMPTPDAAGIVSTKIGYDENQKFIQWTNLDEAGKARKGMSAIAEIRYVPSKFVGEKIALFFDENGNPQKTKWGVHKVAYEFDQFGNSILRKFYDLEGRPINANNGVGQIHYEWSKDGKIQVAQSFLDREGKKVGIGNANIHSIQTRMDDQGRPKEISSYDLDGKLKVDPRVGYAKEVLMYDQQGRLTSRQFLDENSQLSDHQTWEVARFEYVYDGINLISAKAFDSQGHRKTPNWNPSH